MSKKTFANVIDMVRGITNDDDFAREVQASIDSRKLISALMALRAAKGLSQADVAKKLGCSQGRVSKLESMPDADIRYGDLKAYADAIGAELNSGILSRDMKPVDIVKLHAFRIGEHLKKMAELAKGDEQITEGVAKFCCEVFVNMSCILGNAIHALPRREDGSKYCDLEIEGAFITRTEEPAAATGKVRRRTRVTVKPPVAIPERLVD